MCVRFNLRVSRVDLEFFFRTVESPEPITRFNIAATQGEPIVAAADGQVVYSGNELAGYGNMVILRHQDGLMTAYAHADRVLVDKGQEVKRGVAIATVGKSGGVSTPQVHFGVRLNKTPVDPTGYLQ